MTTVFLLHHLDENRPYLNLAMEGLKNSRGTEFEVIVLADSETPPEVPDGFTLVHDRALDTGVAKVHFGVKMADPRSKYFLIHSDDVVLSRDAIATLVKSAGDHAMILNPLTNNDQGSRFMTQLALHHEDGSSYQMPVNAVLEDVRGWEREILDYRSPFHEQGILCKQDWVTFACTMIPRLVFDYVGEIDIALETRHNDEDYCLRARTMGIPTFIDLGAFGFHFGSRTLNKSVKPGEREAATEHFHKKWGFA
jgi:GT2 family glycosyltransferase